MHIARKVLLCGAVVGLLGVITFYISCVRDALPREMPKMSMHSWPQPTVSQCGGPEEERFEPANEFSSTGDWYIPLLATNVEYDFINETTGRGFLARLVDSWADYPAVAHKLLVIGGCNSAVM